MRNAALKGLMGEQPIKQKVNIPRHPNAPTNAEAKTSKGKLTNRSSKSNQKKYNTRAEGGNKPNPGGKSRSIVDVFKNPFGN